MDQAVERPEGIPHRVDDLLADLVAFWPDAGADAHLHVLRPRPIGSLQGVQRAHRRTQHGSAPAGVRDPGDVAHGVVEHDRRAVREAHGQRQVRPVGDHAIGAG